MLFTEINIVHIDSNMKCMEKLCDQNAELLHQVVHVVTTRLYMICWELYFTVCFVLTVMCLSVVVFQLFHSVKKVKFRQLLQLNSNFRLPSPLQNLIHSFSAITILGLAPHLMGLHTSAQNYRHLIFYSEQGGLE
jgi:hypothetical protein